MKKYLILTLSLLALLVILPTTKTSATTKITLNHSLNETLQDGANYNLNGIKYAYSSSLSRFVAMPADNPASIKTIVIYDKIAGVQANYTSLNLDNYTALEDVILFSPQSISSIFEGKTIKNLYMANQNQVNAFFTGFQITNFHFVSPYKGLYSDITYNISYNGNFNNTTITNCYYYDFNKIFFKDLADKYNALSESTHSFQLKNDSELPYTIESFYPFKDFNLRYEQCGVKYYHGISTSSLPATLTNDNMSYVAYEIDSRVKSITAPYLNNTNKLEDITFDTLDIRRFSLGSLNPLKGNTIVVSNSTSFFDTSYVKFKNLYFVYDENNSDITTVTASNIPALEKIYIPEVHKTHFNAIIEKPELAGKIFYYEDEIKTDFVFTNTAKTKTYKSSDDYINIDETLTKISELEAEGVVIPTDCYINEFLDSYEPPVVEEENPYELALVFIFTENIDIEKAIKLAKPYILYKNGIQSSENYQLEIKKETDNKISFVGKYPNNEHFSYTVNYITIKSEVGEFFSISTITSNNYSLFVEATTIKEDITAKTLLTTILKTIYDEETEVKFELPITLTKAGTIKETKTFKVEEETITATAQVIVTKEDLNKDSFTDSFTTYQDEYGETPLLDQIKDKLSENRTLSIILSTVFGILFGYIILLICRKVYKWLKK